MKVSNILNARPNLAIELLPRDTALVREESGYSVQMRGFYSVPELIAIAKDLEALNAVFEEEPETDQFIVVNADTGNVLAGPFESYEGASLELRDFRNAYDGDFEIRAIPLHRKSR